MIESSGLEGTSGDQLVQPRAEGRYFTSMENLQSLDYSTIVLDLKYVCLPIPIILLVKDRDFFYPKHSLCSRAGGLRSVTTTFLPEHQRRVNLLRCHEPH